MANLRRYPLKGLRTTPRTPEAVSKVVEHDGLLRYSTISSTMNLHTNQADTFQGQLLSNNASRDRLLTYQTPTGLPYATSARTEPPVDDYGNEARERHFSEERSCKIEDHQFQEISSVGGAFHDEESPSPMLGDTGDVTLEGESISEQLDAAVQTDKTDTTRRFLPRGDLLRICNFDAVLRGLQEHRAFRDDMPEAKVCAEYICGPEDRQRTDSRFSAREIFAILVSIGRLGMILDFKEVGLVDDDLPLKCNEGQEKLWARKSSEEHHLQFFHKKERRTAARNFFIHQWWVHVPFITRGAIAQEYELAKETILPWSRYEQPVSGAHGDVRRVRIHSNHHNFVSSP